MNSSRSLRTLAPRLPTTGISRRPRPNLTHVAENTMSPYTYASRLLGVFSRQQHRHQSTTTTSTPPSTSTSTQPETRNENAKISCQCGTVTFPASLPKPLAVYICHCTECQKQSASAFGITAMFPAEGMWPLPKDMQPFLGKWVREADSGNTLECYFCKCCGVRVLHRPILPDGTAKTMLSVKGGCVEGLTLEGAKHVYVRSALVPVPPEDVLEVPGVKLDQVVVK
ncbi:hypothetical protein DPV78_004180 [Talaromyces pinophilus]|nr:hypothetical protein DPV78_004180 [Talaromyces pinophilus]